MGFAQKFKSKNKGIAASSIATYVANIKRLARLAEKKEVPATSAWLKTAKLFEKVQKQSLNTQKLLGAAAVKAAQFYGVKHGKWSKLLKDAGLKYEAGRKKQKKTKREAALMPKGGYAKIEAVAKRMRASLPKNTETRKDYNKLQDAWLLSFYGAHTPRLIADVSVRKGAKNHIKKVRGGYRVVLGEHKTSKSHGATTIQLDKRLNEITGRLLKTRPKFVKHEFLLCGAKGGILSRPGLTKMLKRITGAQFGRSFSTQIFRVLKASSRDSEMKKVRTYLNEMGHSLKQDKLYVAK